MLSAVAAANPRIRMYPFGTRAAEATALPGLPGKQKAPGFQGFPPMELAGLEPATSWVRSRRSPN
jgi:hypothetical protein